MKTLHRFLILSLFLLPSGVSAAPDSVVIENHEQVAESDLCHVSGKPAYDGWVELRRHDGSLMRQIACSKGEKQGLDRQFHPDGSLAMERHWKAGELRGRYRRWYADGKLAEEWTYGPQGLEGEYRTYHSNGMIAAIAHWRNGKRSGDYVDYDEHGHATETGHYASGRADGPVISYLPSGEVIKYQQFENGRRVGIQRLWSKDGRLLRRTEYSPYGQFMQGQVWNVDGTLRREVRPLNIKGFGRGLKIIEHDGRLTRTIIQSGTDDPARLAEIGYSFTPNIYKLETVRCGDEIIEQVKAFNHKLLAPVIRKEKTCRALQ